MKTQVPNIQADRIYVVGSGMGGQGAWQLASAGVRIAAIMPIGARSCDEVKRGNTPETSLTAKTRVWAHHNPSDPNSKFSEHTALCQSHLDGGGYGRFAMSPGTGLDWPANTDARNLDVRMEWLLSQSCDTPPNYFVQVDGGVILEFAGGERGFIGDNSRRGYFESESVIRVTAPKTRDGKPFVKWASVIGKFADPAARTATYTTAAGDAQLVPVYGTEPVKLTVIGGTAKPAAPQPGDTVTITADAASFLFWATEQVVDIAHPQQRSFTFAMPSWDVTLTAKLNAPK